MKLIQCDNCNRNSNDAKAVPFNTMILPVLPGYEGTTQDICAICKVEYQELIVAIHTLVDTWKARKKGRP